MIQSDSNKPFVIRKADLDKYLFGARMMDEWIVNRMSDENLVKLATKF